MRIDDEKLRAWGDKLPVVACPYCNGTQRKIKTQAAALADYDASWAIKPKGIFPLVIVECATCGHVNLFSAVKLGLHARPPRTRLRLVKPSSS